MSVREGEEEGLFADTATASAGRPQDLCGGSRVRKFVGLQCEFALRERDLCGGSRVRSGIARKQEFLEQEFVGVVFSSTTIARVEEEEDFCSWSEALCDKNVVVSSSTTVHRENPPISSPSMHKCVWECVCVCAYE